MDDINARVLLCARDPAVIEAVEVIAAALEVPLCVAGDSSTVRSGWKSSSLRLVSVEVASRWSSVPPGRAFLVGTSVAELARCSAELSLPVLPLPDRSGRLADALVSAARPAVRGALVLGLVGASGGLGVSTVTAGLALIAAAGGRAAAAVDLARCSGGLDLVFGAETAAGVRWSDLSGAQGELGDVLGSLPTVDGVGVLASSRDDPQQPSSGAVAAVATSLTRAVQLVVIDSGNEAPPVECDHVLLMVGGDVRSVAAARMLASQTGLSPSGLIVRRGPGRALAPGVVSRALGVPVKGVVGQHNSLPKLAELGLPPTSAPARRYRKELTVLLKGITDD
ncbi:septum site-determining protein Ssd [Tessaracoccus flavus]|nr:septum site-determining protein Ssd [Tessaracoccus flavus]SDZ01446.1 helicase/secretion neighborhood CpaE-like protein [Tessaracoccus flavus]